MSFVESAVLNNTLSWTQVDNQGEVRTIDTAQLAYQELFPSGTVLVK